MNKFGPSSHVDPWKPFRPSDESPWNLPRVWMLHRRTGFAATWDELQRDLSDGLEKSVQRILNGQTRMMGIRDSFEKTSEILSEAALASNRIERLRAWWVFRMCFGSHPLVEYMAVVWHNHFATSNRTIQNLRLMFNQNQIFRELGLGPFPELLVRAVKDPTMLIWLNADDNRESEPNENLGRELLELFSIGVGNYGENDVKEAARALTGWTVMNNEFRYRHYWHDEYEKTVLGKTGNWSGDDVLKIVCDHPATAYRVCWRLCDALFGENVVATDAIEKLAIGLRNHQLDVSWALRTILSSQLFYSDKNMRSRISDPENFVIGNVRMLEYFDPPPSTLALGGWISQLGRRLFDPPNVGGWDGGRLWLNVRTVVARSNFVHALLRGQLNSRNQAPRLSQLVAKHVPVDQLEEKVMFFVQLLLGMDAESDQANQLAAQVAEVVGDKKLSGERELTTMVELLLTSSLAQLC